MLNLSENTVRHLAEAGDMTAYRKIPVAQIHATVRRVLAAAVLILLVILFLPWTQNIRADGKVTSLRPEHRPQTIHATISGRIERWFVVEGQRVRAGDTICQLSEVKTDYFDPNLVARTGEQVSAKSQAIGAYGEKTAALEDQIAAMRAELISKTAQIRNKVSQSELKIETEKAELERVKVDLQVAQRQFEGTKNLYDKGLKSLTDLEEKRLKLQETTAKIVAGENKLAIAKTEFENAKTELTLAQNEYANKIAKTESDKFSAISDRLEAEGAVSKLKIQQENYVRRAGFYFITAPQDGFVVQAIAPGIGEIVKEGEPVVSILPADFQLAAEIFVRPVDLPLLAPGREVRLQFDGWPAFFFSGWPGQSIGTFAGKVAAIDRNISPNGKFRVLVSPDSGAENWPEALRVGGGARGFALLDDVPVWYELWRLLNGFPPNFYQKASSEKSETGKK